MFAKLFVMVLLRGLLCTWILIGIYGSVIAEDFTSVSDPDFSQFLPSEITGPGTELALSLEPAPIAPSSLNSDLFAQTDLAGSDGGNFALDFFSAADRSDDLFNDNASNTNLMAGSGVGCVSYEGQPFSRIRRDNFCVDQSSPQNPPAAVQQPIVGSDATFPPTGSHPGRLSGKQNDPKPRVRSRPNEADNTEEDFMFCPSGIDGYRDFAVCDSGLEKDRKRGVTDHDWSLWDVTHCEHTSDFFLLRPDRLMRTGSGEYLFFVLSSA